MYIIIEEVKIKNRIYKGVKEVRRLKITGFFLLYKKI